MTTVRLKCTVCTTKILGSKGTSVGRVVACVRTSFGVSLKSCCQTCLAVERQGGSGASFLAGLVGGLLHGVSRSSGLWSVSRGGCRIAAGLMIFL